ncbi:hypothetical protein [Vibrio mexicanus]|uniref:hypothetical protein n=1 Tax=Vibrio mexicanus TaxID=1004326 RepID=UPI00069C9B32|nr:hypothetical protein [Vibrio mexicanus]
MNKSPLVLSSLLSLIALVPVAQAQVTPQQELSCEKSYHYRLSLSGIPTGFMTRSELWQGNTVEISSRSRASILGIGTTYEQKSEMVFQSESNQWLTQHFHQQVSGFKNRDMQVQLVFNLMARICRK